MTNDKDSAVIANEYAIGHLSASLEVELHENGFTVGEAIAEKCAEIAVTFLRQPTQSDAQLIANERKAIAAWLRGEVDTDYTDPEYDIGRNLADAVERGAYIQEQSK
jgi:hypothetical protein